MSNAGERKEQIAIGLLTNIIVAVAIPVAVLAWNWASQGGLIRLLGGVTQTEIERAIPPSAIVAFVGTCPAGWNEHGFTPNTLKATNMDLPGPQHYFAASVYFIKKKDQRLYTLPGDSEPIADSDATPEKVVYCERSVR